MSGDREELAARVRDFLDGKERGLSKLISWVESYPNLTNEIFSRIGDSGAKPCRVIGFTGPPGAGKSTLVDSVTAALRSRGRRVGIVAVDPTSPFSGGAMLGDRIRMERHYLDPGVFIRSLASRRGMGGVSPATRDVVRLMRVFGFDEILVETVGVGQIELDILATADTVAVVLVPEAGDSIQTMKAGLMEIGDVFVLNKSDRPGSGELRSALSNMVARARAGRAWLPRVVASRADRDEGIQELMVALDEHTEHLLESGELDARRATREERELLALLGEQLAERWAILKRRPGMTALAARVISRDAGVDELLKALANDRGTDEVCGGLSPKHSS